MTGRTMDHHDPIGQPLSLTPGQSVFGLAGGCLGSHVLASPWALAPLPPCLSFEAAATTPTVFITTDTVLRQAADIKAGEVAFIPAAAGGVGLAALQEAASLGATVLATAGGPPKRAYLRALGVKDVSGSRDIGFVEDLMLQSGGVDVVLNTLTSPGLVSSAGALLKPGGRFIEIGKRDVFSCLRLAQERPDISFGYVAVDFLPEPALHSAMQQLSRRLAFGTLRPLPSANHGMQSVVSALRQMSQARHVGKVVVSNQLPSSSSLPPTSKGDAFGGKVISGTVMIVGGTGTLGLLMASWAAASLGARHIRLLGRTGRGSTPSSSVAEGGREKGGAASGDGGQTLSGLLCSGPASSSCITVLMCDGSSAEDAAYATMASGPTWSDLGLPRQLTSSSPQLLPAGPEPPICAVLHAGGVLADSILGGQSLSSVRWDNRRAMVIVGMEEISLNCDAMQDHAGS